MGVSLGQVLEDLVVETQVLQGLVAGLGDTGMSAATPAAGWNIRDQLTHLAYFDEAATRAAVAPEAFRRDAEALMAGGMDFPDRVAAEHAEMPAGDVLAWLAKARLEFVAVFRRLDSRMRVPWYGPDMSALSSATARLMETWAHGQDVADALGVDREPTDRLRHIAHLGVRTTAFSFSVNGRPVPAAPIRVEVDAPSGDRWTWGPARAADRVTGSALDFCLVVTQRRHLDDTALEVTGPVAAEWLSIAQTFAGAPGTGRMPAASQSGGPS
ncbi:TIGR03084 family metal-binding protein [Amycolatopsis alkalitolerans]|uniref:TIGR03084 family protein n=1 Tax=Amycolatopsis alkalitolerans TaxID=2547244 RepID=A0A5C4MBY6_9PSEU|nr:TIGR03084 family metal-binding protein [Amycolatopsis alkalitolerans]TNC29521.1 TIGR03084 family protein [Amycolatopsis alkalitolerans]